MTHVKKPAPVRSDPFTPAPFAHKSRGSPPSPAAPPRLPRGNPLGESRIEMRRRAEVESCTKNSVGEWDRGELARLERGVGSMRLKFMQQIPQTVQGIPECQSERQADAIFHTARVMFVLGRRPE